MTFRIPTAARICAVLGAGALLAGCDDLAGVGMGTGPMTEGYVVVQDGVVLSVTPAPATAALPVTEVAPVSTAGTGCPVGASVLYGGSRYCVRGGA